MHVSARKVLTEKINMNEGYIFGKNPVIEAYRAGKEVDRLYVLAQSNDNGISQVLREAKKHNTPVKFISRERLDEISENANHQGVIALIAAYEYAEVDDILRKAQEKNEPPFVIVLDDITDPHNFGAILRTANLAGAHGIIIPKDGACPLNATVAKTSAGAVNYTPVARVTNMARTIDDLKKKGLWFAAAVMDAPSMYETDLTGPIGLVVGNEGKGVGRLIREHCDMSVSIPMRGDIDSLNVSVATGVLAFEVMRQRGIKKK